MKFPTVGSPFQSISKIF